MAKYLTSVYVSGWQCSSTASTSNEPGPDVADYPYDTVPNKVARVQDSWGLGFPGFGFKAFCYNPFETVPARWTNFSAHSFSMTESS